MRTTFILHILNKCTSLCMSCVPQQINNVRGGNVQGYQLPESLELLITNIDTDHLEQGEHLQLLLRQAACCSELVVLVMGFHLNSSGT